MRNRRMTLLVVLATLALVSVPVPPPTAAASQPAVPSDFDGDGYADLAIGVAGEGPGYTGAVSVLHGTGNGLSAAGDQLWTQDSPGVKGVASSVRLFGDALASGDFDGDGYADLAIGAPADWSCCAVGSVNVLSGSATGLTATDDQYLTGTDLLGLDPSWSHFGDALASGDFDGDGFWDLAIAGSSQGAVSAAGVAVLYGGVDGLTISGATILASPPTEMGVTLAAGDLDGDGLSELVVGRPSADVGGVVAGAIEVYAGMIDGLDPAGVEEWSQASPGVVDQAENDAFGESLAIGDLDADGYADLAIGVPGETVDVDTQGAVAILYGSALGLTADGNQLWHLDLAGVPGVSEPYDHFGHSLAAGDFDGDGADDLAIGKLPWIAPNHDAVTVLYGGTVGLTTSGAQRWTQDSPGVPDVKERGDGFGSSLSSANYGRSSKDDLAIGVSAEDLGGVRNAGLVNVLYGRASGLSGINAQAWSQGTPGVKGTLGTSDEYGRRLAP